MMVIKGPAHLAQGKLQQILAAGKQQLSEEKYEELLGLIVDLQVYGLTPWINTELGKIMSGLQWELDVSESPEWEEALIACYRVFLGRELKDMCFDAGLSPDGHKKVLCARLYEAGVPEVTEIMDPILKKEETEQVPQIMPQTEPLYTTPIRWVKDRLEKVYRVNPDEFYRRKQMIEKAIKERQQGKVKTLHQFTLPDLQEILSFANRLYR